MQLLLSIYVTSAIKQVCFQDVCHTLRIHADSKHSHAYVYVYVYVCAFLCISQCVCKWCMSTEDCDTGE